MFLSSVQISNFRAFVSATFDVPESGCMSILGANNVGKSALVSALDVVAGFPVRGMKHSSGGEMVVSAEFMLSRGECHDCLQGVRDQTVFAAGLMRKVRLVFREIHGTAFLSEVQIALPQEGWVVAAQARILQPGRLVIDGIPTNTRIDEWYSKGDLQNRFEGGFDTAQSPASIGQIAQIDQLRPFFELFGKWKAGYFHFSPNRHSVGRELEMQESSRLDSNGANLGSVLLGVQHNNPSEWQSLTGLIQELVPGVGLLVLPARGRFVDIAFWDAHTGHLSNLEEMGSGVEQLLMAVTLGLTHTASSLIVLEEPETGLHPSAQRALFRFLATMASDKVFVITTHSTVLVDGNVPAGSEALLVRRHQNKSTVTRIGADWIDVAQELGSRLSDILVADRILVVEGASDLGVLGVWFPGLFLNPRIALVNARGGDQARGAKAFQDWLGQADILEERRVLFLRDKDELRSDELDALASSQAVAVLDVRELENYLMSTSALMTLFLSCGRDAVTEEEVSVSVRKAADALRESVILRTVCRELLPIRLMNNKDRARLIKSKATVDDVISHVSSQIPLRRSIGAQIRRLWSRVSKDINARWDVDWARMAPGADVLDLVFREFLDRGFNKIEDGPKLASLMSPPEALEALLAPISESSQV